MQSKLAIKIYIVFQFVLIQIGVMLNIYVKSLTRKKVIKSLICIVNMHLNYCSRP